MLSCILVIVFAAILWISFFVLYNVIYCHVIGF